MDTILKNIEPTKFLAHSVTKKTYTIFKKKKSLVTIKKRYITQTTHREYHLREGSRKDTTKTED